MASDLTPLSILWFIVTALVAALMWAAQIGPKAAVSNLAEWVQWFGLRPPKWLLSPTVDRVVRQAGLFALAVLCVIGVWIFVGLDAAIYTACVELMGFALFGAWRRGFNVGVSLVVVSFISLGVGLWLVVSSKLVEPPRSIAAFDQGAQAKPAAAPIETVLLQGRYYSAKNKEEVADRLDQISNATKPAEAMLVSAQQAMSGYLWNRAEQAPISLQKMDDVIAAVEKMNSKLYEDIVAKERDYRQELNAILFPPDPLIKFGSTARDYRNALSVWINMRDVQDDQKRRELQQLVQSSQKSFGVSRDELVGWLSRRQELVEQTRRALRS